GIVARDDRIRGIVLNAEVLSVFHGIDNCDEAIHFLGELGMLPKAVLVMVLHAQDNVQFSRERQEFVNGLNHPVSSLLPGHFGIALAAQDTAHSARAAEATSNGDHLSFAFDLPLALV